MSNKIELVLFVAVITLSMSLITGNVMAQVGNMTEVYIPTKDPVQQKWRCQEWQSMTENMKNSSSVVNGTMIKSLGIVVHTYAWKGLIGLYNKRCTGITEFIHPDINIKEKN